MSNQELLDKLKKLEEENKSLKATKVGGTLRVSTKGAVSLYGLGQWPTTLYKSQWLKLLDRADEIKAFIKANEDKLAVKPPKKTAKAA